MTRPFPANSFQPLSQGTLIPPQICICICITFCICICLMLTSICVRFYKPTMHTRRSRNEPDPFKERFNPFVNPFEQHIYTFLTMFTHFVKMPGHTKGNCESRRLLSGTEGGAKELKAQFEMIASHPLCAMEYMQLVIKSTMHFLGITS